MGKLEVHGNQALAATVKQLAQREARMLLRSYCVRGLFYGLCACSAVALGFWITGRSVAPLPIYASVLTASISVSAILGLRRRSPELRLLILADRVLATRELLSTAYELERTGKTTPYFEAIQHDAMEVAAAVDQKAVIPATRLPQAKWIPLLAGLIAFLTLVPFNLPSLLAALRTDSEVLAVSERLGELGFTLEQKARERNLQRTLELSRELTKLSEEMKSRVLSREEAMQRLAELGRRFSEELPNLDRMESQGTEGELEEQADRSGAELALQPLPRESPRGEGGQGSETKGGELTRGNEEGESGEGGLEGGESGTRAPGNSAEDQRALDSALSELDKAMQGLGQASTAEKGQGAGAGKGEREPEDQGAGFKPAERTGEDTQVGGDEGTRAAGSLPGKQPVRDEQGEPTKIQRSTQGATLRVETDKEEGTTGQALIRSLPVWSDATIPERELLAEYQRQAERALATDEVPIELREYVKSYFLLIGLGKER